ncbi:hypothetical protein PNA2_0779 [Pyrococcus sp. NA2]|uniref:hypothetical protein n=1 Tax=Pyrococcus sp. (strain NA2) TaxID=342949 RepID=UPI000209AEE5|nr:hypothetical protein [Pyrococcus sp. NA2]AEC51695.1 hypothetical protein PNA2_0779 [Pyrococcus sp. NA2]
MIDHYKLGYLTFFFMNLTMISGALIVLSKKRTRLWTYIHLILALVTYVLMVMTIWVVR